MVAALHEDAGAAERERLLDLLEDDRLGQQVALVAVSRPAVEGAEVAVGNADVRVVDVAVDDERDAARVGAPRPQRVGRAPDRDELARLEQRKRLAGVDPLAVERLFEDLGDRRCPARPVQLADAAGQTAAPAATKRSSGTSSSSPTSWASSRNV